MLKYCPALTAFMNNVLHRGFRKMINVQIVGTALRTSSIVNNDIYNRLYICNFIII